MWGEGQNFAVRPLILARMEARGLCSGHDYGIT
jgi:hypothetical protein